MVTPTSKTPYTKSYFEAKLQVKFDKSDHFLSKIIDNKMVTLTSETPFDSGTIITTT